jgi:hypothetical protein
MTVLSAGPLQSLVQNEVYALPAGRVMIRSAAALETSFQDTTGFTALTTTTTGVELVAAFVRCTTAGTTAIVRKA